MMIRNRKQPVPHFFRMDAIMTTQRSAKAIQRTSPPPQFLVKKSISTVKIFNIWLYSS